jgi:hypothetical protein
MYIIALMMGTVFCVGGFTIDMGRIYVSYQQLQASTDAAALAAGQAMGVSGATTTSTENAAALYSSGTDTGQTGVTDTGVNPAGVMTTVHVTTTIGCLNGSGAPSALTTIPCFGAGNGNAVQVTQTASVPLTFARFFGQTTFSLSFTSTATLAGSATAPYNIAIILDTTLSQTSTDDNCGSGVTEMTCEEQGVQTLLQELYPCASSLSTCSFTNEVATNPVDQVALFTFPPVTVGSASIDTSCTTPITKAAAKQYGYQDDSNYGYYSMEPETAWTGIATATPYLFPTIGATSYSPPTTPTTSGTYQITNFVSDYKTSDTASSLNTASSLVSALGGVTNCGGMIPPNYDGDVGTYYAGVIYAAQASLVHQQSLYPGSQNVIILLSDGDATAPQSETYNGTTVYSMPTTKNYYPLPSAPTTGATSNGSYPSWNDECAQAVTAAQYAAGQGTRVYSIAYGSETSGCSADSPRISPCTTMQNIASSAAYFYSDYTQSGSGHDTQCIGTGATTTNLQQIFADVAASLTVSRLVPNSEWQYNTL